MDAAERSARPGAALAAGGILLALSIGAILARNTYGAGAAPPPPVLARQAPAADNARLSFVGKVPVLRLRGSHYEVGRQHGAILKPQLDFLYREYCNELIVKAIGMEQLKKWAYEVEPHIPDHYKEELRGLAAGAGYTYEEILLANTMVDRFQTYFCSTVVASGEATKDGDVYFGRNLDFPGRGILHMMTVVIVYEVDGKEPVAAVTWPGLIGVLSGMNAHGVCGATMLIHKGKKLRPGTPYMLMYRDALEGARKTADVAAAIEKTKRTCPNNFMVVDPTGASEVVEWDQDTVARRPAARGCVCSTNHFRSEALKDTGWGWPGLSRYETIEEFLEKEHGKIDAAKITGVLRDTATPWFMNVQSMIFLPRRRELRLSVGRALPVARGTFQTIRREQLFGAVAKAK